MIRYFKLLDGEYKNNIIRTNKSIQHIYDYGYSDWVRTGLFLYYTYPDDDLYDAYEEITQVEADAIIADTKAKVLDLKKIALEIATLAHKGQLDKGGNDYITHPTKVAENAEKRHDNAECYIVGVLHDVLEDTTVTVAKLRASGIYEKLIDAIVLLTKKRGDTYDEYISKIKTNPLAKMVKIEDLKHNMDLSRISSPTQKDFDRIAKYKKSLDKLES